MTVVKRIAPVEMRIAPPSTTGSVNLGDELRAEMSEASVSAGPDAQVTEALVQLRAGTKEGLTSRDHYDLGVAYMGMGLVDDAVREFNAAKDEVTPPNARPSAPTAQKKPKVSAKPAKKKMKAAARSAPKKTKKKVVAAKKKAKAPAFKKKSKLVAKIAAKKKPVAKKKKSVAKKSKEPR